MRLRLPKPGPLIRLSIWLALALLLAACGALPTNSPEPTADGRTVSPITTVAAAQHSPVSPTAAPTATRALERLRLVVLHTNDNWGETEPCG